MGIFNKLFKGNRQEEINTSIDISENGISIQGQLFKFPFNFNELTEIFGQPERTTTFDKSENTIYTWDNVGIYVYAKEKFEIFDISIIVADVQQYDFQPLNPFKQTLTINNVPYKEAIKVVEKAYDTEIKLGEISINAELEYDSKEIIELNICKVKPIMKNTCDKYNFTSIDKEKIEFADFNFKLAVIEELMYNKELLKPKFDVYEFAEINNIEGFSAIEGGYEPIPEVVEYFKALEIDINLAKQVTEIYQDGGNEIYMNIAPQWDGEDNIFNIQSYEDLKHFPNLKKMTLFETDPEIFEELKSKGINAKPL